MANRTGWSLSQLQNEARRRNSTRDPYGTTRIAVAADAAQQEAILAGDDRYEEWLQVAPRFGINTVQQPYPGDTWALPGARLGSRPQHLQGGMDTLTGEALPVPSQALTRPLPDQQRQQRALDRVRARLSRFTRVA
mgnify:CR=1 FL=1